MMFKQSLGFKIIVLVGIVLIVAFAVFAYAYLQVEEKQMLAKSKQMAELLARTIHRSLSEVMLEGKTYKVQKMMASYKPIEEIDGIRIFDPENGLILVDADKASIGGFVDKRYKFPAVVSRPSQANLSSEGGKRLLHVLTPILNEPKCYRCHKPAKRILGMLDIDISVKNIFEDIAKNRFRMIGFVLMTVTVISLIIALLIRYLVNQPIQQLVTTMNRVESGDLTVEIQTTSRDELGKLARSFNSMIARLCSDVERLEVLHKTSEDFRSTINLDEIENIAVQGIVQGLKFDRAVLLLVNEAEQTLKGKVGIGVVEDVVKRVKIPLDRECGILAETVLDAKPFNVQGGMYDISLAPEKTVKCWEFHNCDESDCPAYGSYDLRCWLQSSTHCNRTVQMSFEDKTEVCCRCQVIREAYGKKAMLVLLMFGSRAFATVPLMAQDKATGVIMVDNLYSRRAITDEDIKELSVFAAQAGMAIENAKLYKRLESRIEAADEELKRKVKALTEMKNFNDSIIQNMSNGLVTINIDGRIVYFNSAAEAILGYKAREAQGQPIGDVIGAFEPIFSQTLREDKPFAFHEMTVCTKSGSHIPVEVSTSSLKNDTGETTGVVIIFTDLTERKEMEKQILRADKLATLGQLAAGIAHEIRNPLAGISGAAQILKDEIPKTDLHWEILDEIVEKIKTLENSISDFLRFARPAPLQLSPTDINEVVQSVLFLINKQGETQGVSIVTEYDDSLPIIMADAEQIQQVILNLALNALQAIDEKGGRVLFKTFQTSVPDPQIVVEISDTGVGIPPENLSRIFNPYFTTKGEGTGLGLSIAQRIVEEHGGSISVESEVGKGTTFRVSLSLSLKSSRKFTY